MHVWSARETMQQQYNLQHRTKRRSVSIWREHARTTRTTHSFIAWQHGKVKVIKKILGECRRGTSTSCIQLFLYSLIFHCASYLSSIIHLLIFSDTKVIHRFLRISFSFTPRSLTFYPAHAKPFLGSRSSTANTGVTPAGRQQVSRLA